MKPQLCPCPSCARHIRMVETACPFCRAALPDSFRFGPLPERQSRLLSRAALFALGASLIGAAACDGDAKTPGDASTVDSKGSGGSGGAGSGGSGGSTDASADKGSGGSDGSGSDSEGGAADVASDSADAAVDRGGPVLIYGAASAPR
jgi:hypothetical protein